MRLLVIESRYDFHRNAEGEPELGRQTKVHVYEGRERQSTYDLVEAEIESMREVLNYFFKQP